MDNSPAQHALKSSTLAFAVALGCLLLFLPSMFERYLDSIPRIAGNACVLATALLLHWVFLGIAARRLGRSALAWVAMAVVLFPVGAAAALILLAWFDGESLQPGQPA